MTILVIVTRTRVYALSLVAALGVLAACELLRDVQLSPQPDVRAPACVCQAVPDQTPPESGPWYLSSAGLGTAIESSSSSGATLDRFVIRT